MTHETAGLKVAAMPVAQSADGTKIAYEERGAGPPLIPVDGALCSRSSGSASHPAPILAEFLAGH